MRFAFSQVGLFVVIAITTCSAQSNYGSSSNLLPNAITPLTPTCATGVAGTVTVNGNGKSQAIADEATVSLRISVQNRTADGARQIAGNFADAVFTAVRGIAGIYPDNVTTGSVSVTPVTSKNQDNTFTTIGYTFTNQITVSIGNVSNTLLGQVLDTAVSRGGNNLTISSVTFSLSDALSYNKTKEARGQAARDARATASDYADALGLSLGAILTITDTTYGATPIQDSSSTSRVANTFVSGTDTSAGSTSTSISIGSQGVSASMSMIYTLCNPAT